MVSIHIDSLVSLRGKKEEKKTYMTRTLQAKMSPNRATSHLEVHLVHPVHDGHVSIRVYYEHIQ